MTQTNQTAPSSLSLTTRMIIGTLVGLVVISYFLIASGGGDPAWGRFWMIRPVIVCGFAGAMAGLCNYYILRYRGIINMSRPVAIALSILVSLVGMWMGIVLGLDGTLWN